jgi:hypothetical protein
MSIRYKQKVNDESFKSSMHNLQYLNKYSQSFMLYNINYVKLT